MEKNGRKGSLLLEPTERWSTVDASELFDVASWGKGYFSVSDEGHVLVHPEKHPARSIDLKKLIDTAHHRAGVEYGRLRIANAGKMLWESLSHWSIATDTLAVLDQLLLVLMLVEILHTVRISICSHVLVTEPFLVVGLIASIRRILVITLEASSLTKGGSWHADTASMFSASMTELGLLGLLILILVFSITLLRRHAPSPREF